MRGFQAMSKKYLLFVGVSAAMVAVAAIAVERPSDFPTLAWARKSQQEVPGVAILIEMGLKDQKPASWDNRAIFTGARVVERSGYRFKAGDQFMEPDGWKAMSRGRGQGPRPALLTSTELPGSVGVIYHLDNVRPDATLTLKSPAGADTVIPLPPVLAGRLHVLWQGQAVVRRISATVSVVASKTEDDFPAACHGPDGSLWLAYISYTVRDEGRRINQKPLKQQPANFKAFVQPEFGDQLWVKYRKDKRWSQPIAVTGPHEDLFRCAIAVDGSGDAWVVYSAHRNGRFDLFGRQISKKYSPQASADPQPRPGPEVQLTREGAANLSPVMTADAHGGLHVAFQCWRPGGKAWLAMLQLRGGHWSKPVYFTEQVGNVWGPAVAVGPGGEVAHAIDFYHDGDYDVVATIQANGQSRQIPVASTNSFEARPSIVFDPKGRLWIAYEEGPVNWGKDYGALDDNDGNPLYNARSVRVVCVDGNELKKPVAQLATSQLRDHHPHDFTARYAYPRLGIDGQGRLWLSYRQKVGTHNTTVLGSNWLTFARRLDGDHWTEPIEVAHSDGLLDNRPVMLPDAGSGILFLHAGDGRYVMPRAVNNQIYLSVVDLPGPAVEPKLQPATSGNKDRSRGLKEKEAVARIRSYRIDGDNSKYRLLRGDFHRHTEISFDGGDDGSLEDMFRYAIDAAGLDWIANTDHDSGAGREYSWWLIQKAVDAYHVGEHFTPIFGYERSVPYPHGHRNVLFASRGVLPLPRLAEPDTASRVAGIHADDARMLYRYLRELGGICASHTSATTMGTDWRDNDREIEPIVEIYQGDRNSYEFEGAPRAGYSSDSGKKPVQIAGWKPAGFVDHALKKGYRLGFQSSSDHWATHISYCIVLASANDRQSIMAGLRKRHCYAATDDLIADVRSGPHVMGDEFTTHAPPVLKMTVIGTLALKVVDVIRDSEVIHTYRPAQQKFEATWTDPHPLAGLHYYYVRAEQIDGELAWTSPMWIDHRR
jgi:hypothetical protein